MGPQRRTILSMAPRFGLEARVACNCGSWEPGTVTGHDYTDERLDGQVYPYQVRLDDGRLFCVPLDEVENSPALFLSFRLRPDKTCVRCRSARSVFTRWLRMTTMKMTTIVPMMTTMMMSRAQGNTSL